MDGALRVTRWDAIVFLRASALAALALGLACLITAATDEGGVAWGERAGRTLPLTPVCAAVGAWGALAAVRARGEVRALEALGRSRVQIAAASVAGAAAVALVAALAVATLGAVDVTGFYPATVHRDRWAWEGGNGGRFVSATRGLEVAADGAPVRTGRAAEPLPLGRIPPYGRAAAALVTGFAGLALPMLLAQALLARHAGPSAQQQLRSGSRRWPSALASGVALVGSLMLFQAAAARLVPALLAVVPPAGLLVFAVERFRASA